MDFCYHDGILPLNKKSISLYLGMHIKTGICLIILLGFIRAFSQNMPAPGRADYDIQVSLDPALKQLLGSERISYTNPSDDTLHFIKMHLYYNAFKNTSSTFLSGTMPLSELVGMEKDDNCPFSFTEITAIKDKEGRDLMQNISYHDTEADNPMDETVLIVELISPVFPKETLVLDLDWESRIPGIMPRTGSNKDFYFFAQWFPKMGVYEPAGLRYRQETGAWNCHPYYANGEFYADFGHYDVTISVPSDYLVGASGTLKQKKQHGLYTNWNFELENVIDFAWTCSPHFIEQKKQAGNVEITLLSYPDHEHCAEKYFGSVTSALEYLEDHVGLYPYKTITVVDVPIHGLFTGGMEYPTLITSMSFCFLPVGVKTTQTLTVHEFIHQYFMQMIATNETEEPWMDEGITSYYEGRIVDHYFGGKRGLIDVMGVKISNTDYNRWEYFAGGNPSIADNTYRSWEFENGGYKLISYNKTAVWLNTLDNIVGRQVMDEIMKTYFERWKFNHPAAPDFEKVVNEVVHKYHGDKFGENLNWFFDQVLRGSGVCDYSVVSIKNRKKRMDAGYLEGFEICVPVQSDEASDSMENEGIVIIEREGEIIMPQEIVIILSDGTKLKELWDGRSRTFRFEYSGPEEIVQAVIDPEYKIQLDKNFINNSKSAHTHKLTLRYYFTRFVQWMQNSMETAAWLS